MQGRESRDSFPEEDLDTMNIDDASRIPGDLEALHEELKGIDIEERPSFAPELESELEDVAVTLVSIRRRKARIRRSLVAAAMVGILAVGSVPQARGALIRVIDIVRGTEVAEAPQTVRTATPRVAEPVTQFVPMDESQEAAPEPVSNAVWSDTRVDDLRPTLAYPMLRDVEAAERIIEMHYPNRLQEQGVGGSVRVMIWVDEQGVPEERQVIESSGEVALDRAALNATGRLRFEPARRQGDPVGSWVKFNIQFRPPEPSSGVWRRIIEDEADDVRTDRVADTSGTSRN